MLIIACEPIFKLAGLCEILSLISLPGLPPDDDQAGTTALMIACQQGDVEMVKKLVAYGVDVKAKDNVGAYVGARWRDREGGEFRVKGGSDVFWLWQECKGRM